LSKAEAERPAQVLREPGVLARRICAFTPDPKIMPKAIHTTAGNTCGPRRTRGFDQFDTPTCAVKALLGAEVLPTRLWEPCAGNDAIANVLRGHGHDVVTNDIAADGVDFRQHRKAPPGVGGIVMNPPFLLATEFVAHGLELVPLVIALERIQFLEGDVRAALYDAGKLARVHVFRNRVPRMHRADWAGNRASPAMMLAWFVFRRDHDGSAPRLYWVRCDRGDDRDRAPAIRKEGPSKATRPDDYDAADDMRKSTEWAFQHIRQRVLQGGRGWHGWPEPSVLDRASGPEEHEAQSIGGPG
jgi:hypothetical protein